MRSNFHIILIQADRKQKFANFEVVFSRVAFIGKQERNDIDNINLYKSIIHIVIKNYKQKFKIEISKVYNLVDTFVFF